MFQILVAIGLLLMAIIAIASLSWAFYLDGKLRNRPSPKHYEVHVEPTKVFSDEDIAQVGGDARKGLYDAIQDATELMRDSLKTTITALNEKTEVMATDTLKQEFEKYQSSFANIREETIKDFNNLQSQLDQRQAQLSAELEAHIAKDRENHMVAFNARLGDVVSSYIVETLDKGVDLGAQSAYIIRTLESHKEDIKKDVLS